MKIIITGSAGFIGSALALRLIKDQHSVLGIDNHNNYYNVKLKEDRVKRCLKYKNYIHKKLDIEDA